MRAERILGGRVSGSAVDDVLARARAVLDRIKASAFRFGDPRTNDATASGAATRAAQALASGAREALRFAAQVKDDVVKDLKTLADDATRVAFGPLVILGLVYLLATR